MNPAEVNDLRNLADLAELARPLTHECNNFLNNLLLQLALTERSLPENARGDWANLRREGKKLAGLIQQWQRERRHLSDGPSAVDLNDVIRGVAEEFASQTPPVAIRLSMLPAPLLLHGRRADVQRLIALLVRYACESQHDLGQDEANLELGLEKADTHVALSLRPGSTEAKIDWKDFDETPVSERSGLSLLALTCKSLVERLRGTLQIEKGSTLTIRFVLTSS